MALRPREARWPAIQSSRLLHGAAGVLEHGGGVPLREHGLLQARLHGLALDAEELGRPGPRHRDSKLIDGDGVVGVLGVVAGGAQRLEALAGDWHVAGARR